MKYDKEKQRYIAWFWVINILVLQENPTLNKNN